MNFHDAASVTVRARSGGWDAWLAHDLVLPRVVFRGNAIGDYELEPGDVLEVTYTSCGASHSVPVWNLWRRWRNWWTS